MGPRRALMSRWRPMSRDEPTRSLHGPSTSLNEPMEADEP